MEHIIPLALNGPLELLEASCQACERITGRTEQIALQGIYRGMRQRYDFVHRHKKEQPKDLPVFVDVPGTKDRRVLIPVNEYPDLSFFIHMEPPARLLGVPPGAKYGPEHRYFRLTAIDGATPVSGLTSFNTPSLDLFSFCRMLAKIGHAFAVAEMGLGSFKPLLLDVILRDAMDIFHYVGCTRTAPVPLRSLNEDNAISIDRGTIAAGTFVVVHLKVFGRIEGAPIHQIVVGEI